MLRRKFSLVVLALFIVSLLAFAMPGHIITVSCDPPSNGYHTGTNYQHVTVKIEGVCPQVEWNLRIVTCIGMPFKTSIHEEKITESGEYEIVIEIPDEDKGKLILVEGSVSCGCGALGVDDSGISVIQ